MRRLIFPLLCIVSLWCVVVAYELNMRSFELGNSQVLGAATTRIDDNAPSSQDIIVDTRLFEIAQLRAQDMYQRQYYAHEDPTGKFFFDYFPIVDLQPTTSSCENLYLGKEGLSKAEVYQFWQNSPDHKQCLDAPHTRSGYSEHAFSKSLGLSVYVYIAASL